MGQGLGRDWEAIGAKAILQRKRDTGEAGGVPGFCPELL